MAHAEPKQPPAHADYVDGITVYCDEDHPIGAIDVHWYEDGTVRFQLRNATPLVLKGAYLDGREDHGQLRVMPRD